MSARNAPKMRLYSFLLGCALAALVFGVSACNGAGLAGAGDDVNGDGGNGVPTPPADVCSLLTADEASMLVPGATTVAEEQPADHPDTWIRTCSYRGATTTSYVELQVVGALTSMGRSAIDIQAAGHGDGPRTPVSGLGDHAAFYSSMGGLDVGLAARRGNTLVDLGVNLAASAPTEAALEPFVRRVFDRL